MLTEQGISLQIRTSASSLENLQQLKQKVDAGLVQGGVNETDSISESFASLYYEPVCLFYRQVLNITNVNRPKGLKACHPPS